jgi:hypothetical protein
MATHSPQRQRGEGLDGGDGMTARCQNIPAIQALPPLALGGAGGHALILGGNWKWNCLL